MGSKKKVENVGTPISNTAAGIFVLMTIIAWIGRGFWCALTIFVLSVFFVEKLIKPAERRYRLEKLNRLNQLYQADQHRRIAQPLHQPVQKISEETEYYEELRREGNPKTKRKRPEADDLDNELCPQGVHPQIIKFSYESFDGAISSRTVSVDRVGPEHFSGYCHLRREKRMFKFNRVDGSVTILPSGEVIDQHTLRNRLCYP